MDHRISYLCLFSKPLLCSFPIIASLSKSLKSRNKDISDKSTNLQGDSKIWSFRRPFCKLKESNQSSSSAWRAPTEGGKGRRRGGELRGLGGANRALWLAPSHQVSQMRTSVKQELRLGSHMVSCIFLKTGCSHVVVSFNTVIMNSI